MSKNSLTAVSFALTLSACATNPYGSPPSAGTRAIYGAAIGTAAGALAGSALGDPVSGAGIGAIAGGAIGATVPGTIFEGRRYYRDSRGYCYYVDKNGNHHYKQTVKC